MQYLGCNEVGAQSFLAVSILKDFQSLSVLVEVEDRESWELQEDGIGSESQLCDFHPKSLLRDSSGLAVSELSLFILTGSTRWFDQVESDVGVTGDCVRILKSIVGSLRDFE